MLYIIIALVAASITLLLTPLVRKIAIKNNIVDQPGGRRVNKTATPRMGGVAVVASFWLVILAVAFVAPEHLNFTDATVLGIDRNLFGVLLGSVIIVAMGIVDDVRGLSPLQKLAAQVLAAACIPLFGIEVQWLAHPLGGPDLQLPDWLDSAIAIIWIVSLINVMNWLDGLDGLATGVGSIAALILFFLSLAPFVNQPATALLAIVLFGAGAGFLRYNFHPAKIFLGDTGSMFFGYIIAIIAIISGGKLATASLVLGIPILDAAWVILRRLAAGKSPFMGDRQHLHHRLLDSGLGQRQSVLIYWTLSGLFGGIALASRTDDKVIAGAVLLALMVTMGLTIIMVERRRGQGRAKAEA